MNTKKFIHEEFIHSENQEEVAEKLLKAIKIGLKFKARDKVINYEDIEIIKNSLLEPLPIERGSYEEVLKEFEDKIAQYSVNFGSRGFMGFPSASNAIPTVAASFLTNLLNQNLINSEYSSPAATFVESAVIRWLREIVGYPVIDNPQGIYDIGGIIISGGTMANCICLLAAREQAFPGTKDEGIHFNPSKVKVIIPEYVEHYSIRASLGWIGLGENNVLRVKTKDFLLDLDDLKFQIEKCKEEDITIMAIVAYAGESRSMAIDDLKKIYAIAKKNKIWFHVDACHGMQHKFSEKLKSKVEGLELADSITFDPHKVLFLPYHLSVALFKDPKKFKLVETSSALILMKEAFAFGQITPFMGSKAFWSLKLWFLFKTFGVKAIGALVEERHETAKYLYRKLKKSENFKVLRDKIDINAVMFMYLPPNWRENYSGGKDMIEKLNMLNKGIHQRLFTEGEFYLHSFPVPDINNVFQCDRATLYPLRYMCGNPLVEKVDIDKLVEKINKIGLEEYNKYF